MDTETHQKLQTIDQELVTPTEGKQPTYENVKGPSNSGETPGVTELDDNQQDISNCQKGTAGNNFQVLFTEESHYKKSTTGMYEDVKAFSPGCTKLRKYRSERKNTTEDGASMKSLDEDLEYCIPEDKEREPYENMKGLKNLPGYQELDIFRREYEDFTTYQKLIKLKA